MIHIFRRLFSPFDVLLVIGALFLATSVYPTTRQNIIDLIGNAAVNLTVKFADVLAKVCIGMGTIGFAFFSIFLIASAIHVIFDFLYDSDYMPSLIESGLYHVSRGLKAIFTYNWWIISVRILGYGYLWAFSLLLLAGYFQPSLQNAFDTLSTYLVTMYPKGVGWFVLALMASGLIVHQKEDVILRSKGREESTHPPSGSETEEEPSDIEESNLQLREKVLQEKDLDDSELHVPTTKIQELAEDLLPWIYAYKYSCEEKEIPESYRLVHTLSGNIHVNKAYIENVIHQKLRVIGIMGGFDLLYAVHSSLKEKLTETNDDFYLLVYDRNANGIAGWML